MADDEVRGFAHAIWDAGVGNVLRLYVAPDRRGRGVGRDLLSFTEDELRRRGADRVQAMVLDANVQGNEFYRALGYDRHDTGETVIGGERYAENVYAKPL